MLRFKNGLLLSTTMSHAGVAADQGAGGGGGGGGGQGAANAFLASLPDTIRSHEALKDVGDVGTLAQRYLDTQKPFAERLPEKIRGEAYFKDIKSFEDLATKAYSQAKFIGRDPNTLVTLPASDDAKEWDGLYNKLGRPESADKYAVPKPGEGREYSDADKALQAKLLPVLHKAGISQRQLEAIVPEWNAIMTEFGTQQATETAQSIAQADEALTKEWGAAKSEKLALAKGAVSYFAETLKLGDGLKLALERPGPDGKPIGNDPAFARLFAHLGEQMREDGLIGKGGGGARDGALSPAEAQQQINALQRDEKFMADYMNKKAPGHADAVARMQRLYEYKVASAA